jgi:response regulator of citrate/malate metabolism
MISVLIVEDETTAAEALIEYVGRVSGFEVIGNARTGADALPTLIN